MEQRCSFYQVRQNHTQDRFFDTPKARLRIFFVCGICRKLVHYSNRISNAPSKKNMGRRQTYMSIKYDEFTFFYKKVMNDQKDYLQFQSIIELAKSQNISEFPICRECVEFLCTKMQKKCKLYSEMNNCLKCILNNSPNDILKNQLDALVVQKESLNDSITNAEHCNNLLRTKSRNSRNSVLEPQKSSFNLLPTSRNNSKKTSTCFKSLTLHFTFQISFSGHYGTINDCRIGIRSPYDIDTFEFDSGIFFLVQLIMNIARLIDVEFIEIQAKMPILFLDKTYIPLSLENINGKNYLKGIRSFRKGIETIFVVCEKLFSVIYEKTNNFMPPNTINLKEHKIFKASYVYDKDQPEVFTYAMKLLLFDLKCIQRYLFEEAIEAIE